MSGKKRSGKANASKIDESVARRMEFVLFRLPGVERSVVDMRFGISKGHPKSYAEIASELGMSASEVREIEARALSRLRETVDQKLLRELLQHVAA